VRAPERIKPIMEELERVWRQNPDWRLGQLIVNASDPDPFYVEDELMLEGLKKL
jgi:hypothetical protein